jgi:hypothetical protein
MNGEDVREDEGDGRGEALTHDVARELDDFHSIVQRFRDGVERVGSRDEEDTRKIEPDNSVQRM